MLNRTANIAASVRHQRFWLHRMRLHNGINDLAIAGTAAQNAGKRILDFSPTWLWVVVQQMCRRHQHTRRTDATLRRAIHQKTLLQLFDHAGLMQPLNTGHRLPIDLPNCQQTAAHRRIIKQNGTGPAITRITANFGAGETKFAAQHITQPCCRVFQGSHGFAIQRKADPAHYESRPVIGLAVASRRRTASSTASIR